MNLTPTTAAARWLDWIARRLHRPTGEIVAESRYDGYLSV